MAVPHGSICSGVTSKLLTNTAHGSIVIDDGRMLLSITRLSSLAIQRPVRYVRVPTYQRYRNILPFSNGRRVDRGRAIGR